jgi:hypothetical protein
MMTISGIGVQRILPRSGTAWRETKRAPGRHNSNDNDETPTPAPDRLPSEAEPGQLIDRNV